LPASATTNDLSGDLTNIAYGWEVMNTFKPELMVINTFNLDVCHSDFTGYLQFLHKADYGIGWLWNKIQSTPGLMNDTVLICMPEHGRNLQPNAIYDANGLRAFDHTSDQNSRRMFGLIVGPSGKVKQNVTFGSQSTPVGESIDMAPTIAHILGFENDIPAGLLPGRVLTEAFV
jgi:phosphoglycerol transferase MdoB-like AlkP superfamily enzyme